MILLKVTELRQSCLRHAYTPLHLSFMSGQGYHIKFSDGTGILFLQGNAKISYSTLSASNMLVNSLCIFQLTAIPTLSAL